MAERVIAAKAVADGVLLVCSCGVETHVVTVRREAGELVPTPMEQAFTCEGCGTPHWFRIEPPQSARSQP